MEGLEVGLDASGSVAFFGDFGRGDWKIPVLGHEIYQWFSISFHRDITGHIGMGTRLR